MCDFKNIDKASNINEIQSIIIRSVSRKDECFNYQSIIAEIKYELSQLGVSQSIVDSYKVAHMIDDTLEQMIDMEDIVYYNNIYTPHKNALGRIKYAFG